MIAFFFKTLLILSAHADSIEVHKQEVAEIAKKTEKFERRIQDLQVRKAQSREGEELEGVLTEISNVHKELLGLRRERNTLKEHLIEAHPDSNLLYDSSLHKSFNKGPSDKKGPLDDRLDSLLALMQSQYGKYITHDKEVPVDPNAKKTKTAVVKAVPLEAPVKPLTKEEIKDAYMRDKIKTEMKVAAPTPEEQEKLAAEKKAAAEKAAAEPKAEPAKASGHH